jgi:hypothetical protein
MRSRLLLACVLGLVLFALPLGVVFTQTGPVVSGTTIELANEAAVHTEHHPHASATQQQEEICRLLTPPKSAKVAFVLYLFLGPFGDVYLGSVWRCAVKLAILLVPCTLVCVTIFLRHFCCCGCRQEDKEGHNKHSNSATDDSVLNTLLGTGVFFALSLVLSLLCVYTWCVVNMIALAEGTLHGGNGCGLTPM